MFGPMGGYWVQATFRRGRHRVHLAAPAPGCPPVLLLEESGGRAVPPEGEPYAHPHLPRVLGAVGAGKRWYRVLEVPAGERLDRLLARGPLAEERALALTAEVCAALEHLHRLSPPWLLGYLSPRWVRVDAAGRVTVNFLAVDPELDGRPDAHLNPAFMAPEVRAGRLLPASDVYSAGMLLAALTGTRTPVRRRRRRTPTEEIIARATAPDLRDRLPGMAALRAMLAERQAELAARHLRPAPPPGGAESQPPGQWLDRLARSLPPVEPRYLPLALMAGVLAFLIISLAFSVLTGGMVGPEPAGNPSFPGR